MLAEWMGAVTLNIDEAVAGTGTVPEASLLAQTALANQKQEVSIVSSKRVDKGWKVKVQVVAPYAGYTLNQIGVKGHLEDGASVLLALFQNEDGIPIPSNSESPDFVYSFYGILSISNTGKLAISVDTSALVSTSTLQEALTEYVPTTRKINNKALNADVTLAAADVGARPDTWTPSAEDVGAVPTSRTINGKSLSGNVTLTGADIQVSSSDETSVSTALSNKVSHTADYVPAMQDLHGDARGLVCTVPAAAGPEIASINAPPGVEWGTCLSLQVGDIRTLMLIDTSGLWIQYGRPSGWTDWIHIATATPPQEYDLPLAEGWTSQISGSCRYAKSQENIVFVTFKVVHDEATPASTDTMIATLPEGFWPSALVHSVCIRSDFVSSGIAVFCTETGGIWIRSSQEIPSGAGVAGEIIFVAAS